VGGHLGDTPGVSVGLPAPPLLFLVVSGLVLVVVLRALPRTPSVLQATAYGLLLSGALGNVIDRLLRPGAQEGGIATGYVVDFVAWGSFPRFNVADSAITVGFVLLVVALYLEERREAGDGPGDLPGADRA
jgi:signal peptidase II